MCYKQLMRDAPEKIDEDEEETSIERKKQSQFWRFKKTWFMFVSWLSCQKKKLQVDLALGSYKEESFQCCQRKGGE